MGMGHIAMGNRLGLDILFVGHGMGIIERPFQICRYGCKGKETQGEGFKTQGIGVFKTQVKGI